MSSKKGKIQETIDEKMLEEELQRLIAAGAKQKAGPAG